ncbi:MAG: hypothetical protein LIP06_13390 [Tannerellaceae bacterium]|nr:hypothetical protein [Tannerellaceae bacterium]
MNSNNHTSEQPTPWYWNQPEQGISLEDCERLFYELIHQYRTSERSQKKYTAGDSAVAF